MAGGFITIGALFSVVVAAAVFRLWFLAAVGNLLGAWLVGYIIEVAHDYSGSYYQLLAETEDAKMKYRTVVGVDGWAEAVVSGVLGNRQLDSERKGRSQ